MNDHQVLSLLHAFKVSKGEWSKDHKPSVQELSKELRNMGRLDVASRIEAGETVWVLRD